MEHITVGRKYNEEKIAFVECVRDGSLDNINIKDYTYQRKIGFYGWWGENYRYRTVFLVL